MAFYLVWDSADFGSRFERAGYPEVRAAYATREDAERQGDHDLAAGRRPLRVEDEDGAVLREFGAPAGEA